jgi:tRNA (Thr-GGU) A37 N-methylase
MLLAQTLDQTTRATRDQLDAHWLQNEEFVWLSHQRHGGRRRRAKGIHKTAHGIVALLTELVRQGVQQAEAAFITVLLFWFLAQKRSQKTRRPARGASARRVRVMSGSGATQT